MDFNKIIAEDKLTEFEKSISYRFQDRKHLILALTHSSYANENRKSSLSSNERLEFLGDSVLNLIISKHIFHTCSQLSEGELTRIRASIVCEPSLMLCANKIKLGDYLLLGKGEELTGGRERTSILSDAFEALIGAVFLDSGFEEASAFVKSHMKDIIENCLKGNMQIDYKTHLQESIQKSSERKISYELVSEKGPDHNKLFVVEVKVDGVAMGKGQGKSKKEAEQNAAREAVEKEGL